MKIDNESILQDVIRLSRVSDNDIEEKLRAEEYEKLPFLWHTAMVEGYRDLAAAIEVESDNRDQFLK